MKEKDMLKYLHVARMNCATKVRFFLSNFWGAVQKGCFFYRFLVLRLHKKAL